MRLVIYVVVVLAALLVLVQVALVLVPGRSVIESLESPVAVIGWSGDGLLLEGDSTLTLPGILRLPDSSDALNEATRHGVEVSEAGRVVGLVRVHHWCGNDLVRRHLARVDLADMLRFLGEGVPATSPAPCEDWGIRKEQTFTGSGWKVEDYLAFRQWSTGQAP